MARAFEVNPNVLQRWRREFRDGPGHAFPGPGKRRWDENRVAQLERKIGQQTLEIDFLKGCLQRIEEQRQLQAMTGKPLSSSKRERAETLSLRRMCVLAGVSRAGFYHFRPSSPRPDRDLELRDALQHIALEFPCYGWSRIMEELKRRGWTVNHNRVYRLMREDNLLCLRKRKVVTTNSDHGLPVYPNRAPAMVLTGLDQLWVADITYIRLLVEFVYLAVILDAFSRREIGWAMERNLEDTLTLGALRMAIERRWPAPGLVHHSDRGVQYASRD